MIHGKGGNKEDARGFAERAAQAGWQTVAIDLPVDLQPWDCHAAVRDVFIAMQGHWHTIGVRATSIGAWFATAALDGEPLAAALFESPLFNTVQHIEGLMESAKVDRELLRERSVITPASGPQLSWDYLQWAEDHIVQNWMPQTFILSGSDDELVPISRTQVFAHRWGAQLEVLPGSHHWIHTPPELRALAQWETKVLALLPY